VRVGPAKSVYEHSTTGAEVGAKVLVVGTEVGEQVLRVLPVVQPTGPDHCRAYKHARMIHKLVLLDGRSV
jgi:hypothetical protein